jgi:hypothetical protein
MSTAKFIEFEVIIKDDGTLVHDVTAREEGANCNAVRKIAQKMGNIILDETTGPFCDKQNETA